MGLEVPGRAEEELGRERKCKKLPQAAEHELTVVNAFLVGLGEERKGVVSTVLKMFRIGLKA